jgi:phosphonate transport system permease protein
MTFSDQQFLGSRQIGWATWATFIIAALFVWSLIAIEFSPGRMIQVPGQVARVLSFLWPADMAYGWDAVLPAIVESIQIAWIGTIIAADSVAAAGTVRGPHPVSRASPASSS